MRSTSDSSPPADQVGRTSGAGGVACSDEGSLFADDFHLASRRRVCEIGGLVLIACVGCAVVALATWSVDDPTFDSATSAPVRNMLGVTGAIAADLTMRLFGMATIALVIPPGFWGWRFFTYRTLDRLPWRLVAWVFGVVASVMFAATLNRPAQWPLPTGDGGAVGDAVVGMFTVIAGGPLHGVSQTVMASVLGALAVALTGVACGFGFHRRDDMCAALSAKASALRAARSVVKAVASAAELVQHRAAVGYELPITLLTAHKALKRTVPSMGLIRENAAALEHVLRDFGVGGKIINARLGPVVTLYELEPARGIKSSRIIGLTDDIARSMCALSARVAVVPGHNVIGIELPNQIREKVYLRELLAADKYVRSSAKLPLCLGKTIGGEAVIVDLACMPHLLIAGTTGSGKSVAINTMILSLLYRLRPEQCRLIMVDPKMLELSVYDGIPHLLVPVVTNARKAVVALKWAVREMEDRYRKMSKLGVRNIDSYNARLEEAKTHGEALSRMIHTGYDAETGEAVYENEEFDSKPLPYLVIIVDEMADLMMVAGKDIEGAIQRLAQMARAAGIHVVVATQRPSVDVITGTIKANFPTRISFQVTSKIDSRTILGEQGAEQLLGQGDMLYMAGGGRISRIHGPFVSDEEVDKVVRHLKSQRQPQYLEAVTAEDPDGEDGIFELARSGGEAGDLYQQAVQIVTQDRKPTTNYLQRRLQIGHDRAAALIERMEREGIIGLSNHTGKREITNG